MANTYQTIEEASYGATYRNPKGEFTVYEIGTYPGGSVLAGQQKRSWKGHFKSLSEAKEAFPEAELIEGSTYQEPYVGHLPDDDDY